MSRLLNKEFVFLAVLLTCLNVGYSANTSQLDSSSGDQNRLTQTKADENLNLVPDANKNDQVNFQKWLSDNSSQTSHAADQKTEAVSHSNAASKKISRFDKEQKQLVARLPESIPQPSEDSEAAFQGMVQQNLPLAPQQIVKLHQQIDLSQRAAAIPATIPPKPVSSTLIINQAPGTTPPAVRLAQGYVTSLVFVDSTGAPWSIASFDIGNPKAMNVQWDGKSNIILLQANAPYSDGNMVVRLQGLNTPITLELVSGQRVVDYRADLHVSGIAPDNKNAANQGTDLPASANQLLLGVLDGVAPPNSKPLKVKGSESQAWILSGQIYLRTRMTLLSPGWISKMVSPDGMNAYQLPKTSSILVSRYGEPVEIKLEGF